ncbi:pitrilysin family protein [soil metagenome]
MNYKKHTLKNGLRIITVPMPSSESATLTVWANVGSRYEADKIAGLSHFLEHIVFKGTKKYPSALSLSGAVDAMGAEFNAGTSKEWTNFYIQSAKTHLEKSFDVLSDMILNPLIKEDDVKKEKGVILEEMAMYEDMPIRNIGDVFEELIFKGNPLGRDTIGTTKAIKATTSKNFIDYKKLHYFPKNLLITVAGAVTEKEVIKLSEKYFGGLKANPKPTPKKSKFIQSQTKPEIKLKTKKVEQAHLIIGFPADGLGATDRFAEGVLATILGGGMSSRLFTEVREKRGLAYSVRANFDRYTDVGSFQVYAGVDPSKAEEALEVILNELYSLKDESKKITNEEFIKAKEFIKGHIALSLEDTSNINQFFGEQELLKGKIDTPEDIYKGIDKVKVEEVIKVAKKLFIKEKLNLAIIGPYQSSDKFKPLIKVTA